LIGGGGGFDDAENFEGLLSAEFDAGVVFVVEGIEALNLCGEWRAIQDEEEKMAEALV
jgi:hypothetical protein